MFKNASEMLFNYKKWYKSLFRLLFLAIVIAVLLPSSALPRSADRLVDDDEYKDKDFHRGIITDYSDMAKGNDVNWVWVNPGEKLGDYKVKVVSIENKSDTRSRVFADSVKSIFEDYFDGLKGTKGPLTAELCITETQEYSPGKAFIPFAGGHQAQAGVGMEAVLRDQNNNIVAKLRDFERRGADLKQAAEDVASHMSKEIGNR